MPTPIKLDAQSLHRRLAIILARQIKALADKQRSPTGLSFDDVKQFKILADALDDQIKLRRMLDADLTKQLEKLPDDKLEEIAKSAASAPEAAPKPPASIPQQPQKKPRSARATPRKRG